ncbi:hypothetical protein EW145_g3612 [Phellinidium pouzarii]|uniref:EB1 C-terminal domain-containing protein n=1 Tax=Phellinidium pouzarii TaxID=167371 RepID=A0A4S4L6S2_9AGAM|nr:hypothetical protein EW145_g3612 [Phellinidium pouzarii]
MKASLSKGRAGNINNSDQSGRSWRSRGQGHWRQPEKAPNEDKVDAFTAAGNHPQKPISPKLTHFISIPLDHIPVARTAVSSFTSALLAQSPPIRGLEESIVIPARRLHLTLGVMSLAEDEVQDANRNAKAKVPESPKTVSASVSLLQSLRPRILDVLGGATLYIPLTCIDIMKPERGDLAKAHVMFAGPPEDDASSETVNTLRRVCELVSREFIIAGLAVDQKRPLKLHCTLLNTSSRKFQPKNGRRTPFSFADVLASDAFKAISANPTTHLYSSSSNNNISDELQTTNAEAGGRAETHTKPFSSSRDVIRLAKPAIMSGRPTVNNPGRLLGRKVDLGTYAVTKIEICVMGSKGAEGDAITFDARRQHHQHLITFSTMGESRTELIAWLNDLLQVNYTKIEQCGTGGAYCQVMDSIYGDVPMSRVKMNAKHEYEYIANFKIMQNFFKTKKIEKVSMNYSCSHTRREACKMQNAWIKKYWDANYGGQGYDAVARRRSGGNDTPATIAPIGGGLRTSSGPGAHGQVTNEVVQQLRAQLAEMSAHLEGLEKERDFYFAKLRDIEILVQAQSEENEKTNTDDDTLKEIQKILYSTEEGFEVPEGTPTLDEEETF